jgi:ferredoxin
MSAPTFITNAFAFMPVIDKDRCHPCGACVKACERGVLAIQDAQVAVVGRCVNCLACVKACPRAALRIDVSSKATTKH